MASKKERLEVLDAQIENWKCEMKALEEKATSASDEVKAQCSEAMDAVRCQYQEGEAKADDAWEEFQQEAEESLAAFKTSVAESIQRVNAFFA